MYILMDQGVHLHVAGDIWRCLTEMVQSNPLLLKISGPCIGRAVSRHYRAGRERFFGHLRRLGFCKSGTFGEPGEWHADDLGQD